MTRNCLRWEGNDVCTRKTWLQFDQNLEEFAHGVCPGHADILVLEHEEIAIPRPGLFLPRSAQVQLSQCLLIGQMIALSLDDDYLIRLRRNRVGGFRPLTHHRTCLLWHTAVSRRVIGPGTDVPAATLYLSSSDTLTTPPHRYVDSDLHRFPSFSRGFVHFSTSWLCCYRF